MSCGRPNRTALFGAGAGDAKNFMAESLSPAPEGGTSESVVFEYVGDSSISAIGSVTRKLYRFAARHARVAVDPRDAASVARVPYLRRVP